ncbi:hypothetical protein RUM44_007372 [Polyplax serrata]|uniref:Uncharacterized protein n=1 Tax=Polyplax serrata TaxID=468196 RepID=A0ABR1B0K1_POLSC
MEKFPNEMMNFLQKEIKIVQETSDVNSLDQTRRQNIRAEVMLALRKWHVAYGREQGNYTDNETWSSVRSITRWDLDLLDEPADMPITGRVMHLRHMDAF